MANQTNINIQNPTLSAVSEGVKEEGTQMQSSSPEDDIRSTLMSDSLSKDQKLARINRFLDMMDINPETANRLTKGPLEDQRGSIGDSIRQIKRSADFTKSLTL